MAHQPSSKTDFGASGSEALLRHCPAMIDEYLPNAEIILYQTQDGRTRIQC